MGTRHLWFIDRDGRVFLFNLRDKSWRHISTPKLGSRNCFKRVSAVEQCAWAISASQQPYLFVHSTELPIRVKVQTYENQRWGIYGGWKATEKSILMKHTDRWGWSSKNGKLHLPKESFQLPSVEWIWEGDWYIDHGIEVDNEGWQYAVDFPATYRPKNFALACVRRRLWSRYYRFDGYDQWIKVPGLSEDPCQQPFQDIAVGGTAIPGQEPGYLAVWAVTFQGKVVYRSGISEKCPEGDKWIEIPSPQVSITQLSVSPSGIVWGVTWEGVAVVRSGVTCYEPFGTTWEKVASPDVPQELGPCRLLQVSAGLNSVWALTKDGQVWFRKGLSRANGQENAVTGSKWVEMVGKFSLITVGLNDQVFALSTLGDHIYFRTDVTPDELVGRTWKVIDISKPQMPRSESTGSDMASYDGTTFGNNQSSFTESDDSYSAQSTSNLPCNIEFLTWLSSGACQVDAAFFTEVSGSLLSSAYSMSLISLSSRDAAWRKTVIQRLRTRDAKESPTCDKLYEEAVSQGEWWKKGHFQLLFDANSNMWCHCLFKLDPGGEDRQGALLCYFEKNSNYEEMRIPLHDITCVCVLHKMSRNHCFAIHTPVRTQQRNPLVIHTGNEKDLNDWVTSLSGAVSRVHNRKGPASPRAIWATTRYGDVFFCETPLVESEVQPAHLFWHQIGGHMDKVESGAAGVVWGISFDGLPFYYTGGYGGGIFAGFESSVLGIHQQEDYEWHYIFENQRWNPLEGYSDRRLPSDRWNWSDESGVYERTREGYSLPSSQWQWSDEQWTVETKPNVTDKDGWQYAVDFPRSYHRERGWNDYVRRRRWKRKAKLTTTGPWMNVTPQVRLRDVSIQMDVYDGSVAVWAVGTKGDVLYRHGVTEDCPQGTAWEHILTDLPFISISVGCKRRVWGIAENGTAYFRAGFGENNITGTRWFHISEKPPHLYQVSAGATSVWAREKNGTCWYRQYITDSYPEGTSWLSQQFKVTSLSIGPNNQAWMINRNAIERRYKVTQIDPLGRGWEVVLSDHWRHISVRAAFGTEEFGEIDEAEEAIKEVQFSQPSSLLTPVDLSEVDIYSMYSRNDTPQTTPASELDEDELYEGT